MNSNEQELERVGFRSALLLAGSSFLFYAGCALQQSSGWRYEQSISRAILIPIISICSFYALRWALFGRIRPLWISIKEPAAPPSDGKGNLTRLAVAGFFLFLFMSLISINLARETLDANRDISTSVDGVEQKLDLGITVNQP